VVAALRRSRDTPAKPQRCAAKPSRADLAGWVSIGTARALFQSEPASLYDAAHWARLLASSGQLYPCHCSRRMLADLSAAPADGRPIQALPRRSLPIGGTRMAAKAQLALAAAPGRLHGLNWIEREAGWMVPTGLSVDVGASQGRWLLWLITWPTAVA